MKNGLEQRLHEVLAQLSSEDVHAVVAFGEFLSQRRHPRKGSRAQDKLSKKEHARIVRILNGVAALSAESGASVTNRDHDRYLYGAR